MKLSHQDAAVMLSEYLSMLFRADIQIPVMEMTEVRNPSLDKFIKHLPRVVQRAVDGAELIFSLPLVQGSKGTSLSPQVAQTVNSLLREAAQTAPLESNPFDVPTFFYSDGSTMVVTFNPIDLSIAMQMMAQNPFVAAFVANAIKVRA